MGQRWRSLAIITIAVLCAVAASCNGGGGGGGSAQPTSTPAIDTTPDQFHFTDLDGILQGYECVSQAIVITGINAKAAITVFSPTGSKVGYSINGLLFTSAPGWVKNGDVVQVRLKASTLPNTTATLVLTVGGVSAAWNVTTGP